MCVRQTRAKVIGFKFRIVGQNSLGRFALCEQAKDEFDGNAQPANDRLAAENLEVAVIRPSSFSSIILSQEYSCGASSDHLFRSLHDLKFTRVRNRGQACNSATLSGDQISSHSSTAKIGPFYT